MICLKLQMNPLLPRFLHIVFQDKSPLLLIKPLKKNLPVNKQLLIVPEFDLYFVLIHQTPLNGFFHTPQISLKETPGNNGPFLSVAGSKLSKEDTGPPEGL